MENQQNDAAKNFKYTRPGEQERMTVAPQKEQSAGTPKPPWPKQKGTKPSDQIIRLLYKESQNRQELHHSEKREPERENSLERVSSILKKSGKSKEERESEQR